jgi:hypothetical protein
MPGQSEGGIKVAETKYGKYIMREPHAKWESAEPQEKRPAEITMRVNSSLISQIGCDFAFVGVTEAKEQGHPSHKHDVDEYIFFVGSDPANVLDFQAEVELTLGEGEDEEKHIIDCASVVFIPAGLAHLPMNFKKVDKPFLFGHFLTSSTYTETRL